MYIAGNSMIKYNFNKINMNTYLKKVKFVVHFE